MTKIGSPEITDKPLDDKESHGDNAHPQRADQITCRTLARRTTIGPSIETIAIPDFRPSPNANRHLVSASPVKMRTYDDSFSGQKIYPGKVRSFDFPVTRLGEEELCGIDDIITTSRYRRQLRIRHVSAVAWNCFARIRMFAGGLRMLMFHFVVTG